jgi:hypothetical protein
LQHYNGNIDFQCILGPTEDVEPYTEGETLSQWCNRYNLKVEELSVENHSDVIKNLLLHTNILDTSHMMESIIAYICGYCCKAEPSQISAKRLLDQII